MVQLATTDASMPEPASKFRINKVMGLRWLMAAATCGSFRYYKTKHYQACTMSMNNNKSNCLPERQGEETITDHCTADSLERPRMPQHQFESNSTAANAFSNSLAAVALKASTQLDDMSSTAGGDSSSSSGGDTAIFSASRARHSASHTWNDGKDHTSGSSDGAGTGGSGHVVTATPSASTQTGTTTTTSSGDDRGSSRGNESAGGTLSVGEDGGALSSENSSDRLTSPHIAPNRGHHRHRHQHYHYHRAPRSVTAIEAAAANSSELMQRANDGSTLQLPGDDGSDRLSTGPATVVASRMPPPNADSTTSSSGSGGEGEAHDGLLQPHREPGYHTIRKTFSRLPKRAVGAGVVLRQETSSSEEQMMVKRIKGKHGYPKTGASTEDAPKPKKTMKRSKSNSPNQKVESSTKERGRGSPSPESSSGSGTEGGYMGSADSKENESSSSRSVSSSEGARRKKTKRHRVTTDDDKIVVMKAGDQDSGDCSSSEIADFSSGTTSENGEEAEGDGFATDPFHSSSPSLSSSNEDEEQSSEDGYEASYAQAKNHILQSQQHVLEATTRKRKAVVEESRVASVHSWPRDRVRAPISITNVYEDSSLSPILSVGSDIMAHVLTFLQPPKILEVLTMPLSKEWRQTFTLQPELWRVLCLVEPFKAEIDDDDMADMDDSSSTDSFCSLNEDKQDANTRLLGKYRLLYTSFVRCMKYLSQIREDALNGRAPSYIDYGLASNNSQKELAGENRNLQRFFARARVLAKGSKGGISSGESSTSEEPQQVVAGVASMPKSETCGKRKRSRSKSKTLKIGQSMITDRLLGPSADGQPGSLDLPWSCAIYSIVNWMVSFSDVEGIQTLCMKVLPFLLENEQQRQTAQRAGLTDVVLRAMVLFPNSVQLHIAAFHTIVLLARPLGGREGMLFHSSMILSGIFGGQNTAHPKSGIAVMVESMNRFEDNDVLQAMSCWALVNIALAPAQKAKLVKLGGIEATSNAMLRHPFSAEVQFRALFALINLVIPSVRFDRDDLENEARLEPIRENADTSEKQIIDESVSDITGLVVRAMKNFCSSEAILNRACLVLHNLSLTQEYHSTLLLAPSCYQMLEWCLANYRTDQVLQQSATGTLHRLQMTLSRDDDLRAKFTEKLQAQQQVSLYQAHREALRLHQLQEEVNRAREDE